MYSEENNRCFNCSENRLAWIYRTGWGIGAIAENLVCAMCALRKLGKK